MDINRENYELGLPVIKKAGVAHKIEYKEGLALPVLDLMIEDEKNHGAYDFIFVHTDKDNYINYHKCLIDLVRVGGVISYDNMPWNGSVAAAPDAPMRKYVRYFETAVSADLRWMERHSLEVMKMNRGWFKANCGFKPDLDLISNRCFKQRSSFIHIQIQPIRSLKQRLEQRLG